MPLQHFQPQSDVSRLPIDTCVKESGMLKSKVLPQHQCSEKERYKDAICQSTAVANHVDPKSDTTTVIAMELWKGSAKGESPKTFAISVFKLAAEQVRRTVCSAYKKKRQDLQQDGDATTGVAKLKSCSAGEQKGRQQRGGKSSCRTDRCSIEDALQTDGVLDVVKC
mmetsp:Transcript_22427/g.36735  ORF Transcript_22427/g.36735 Transcript_22427/m.36735 type:complete len:167 (-) Transcript_22427:548-1048(-)